MADGNESAADETLVGGGRPDAPDSPWRNPPGHTGPPLTPFDARVRDHLSDGLWHDTGTVAEETWRHAPATAVRVLAAEDAHGRPVDPHTLNRAAVGWARARLDALAAAGTLETDAGSCRLAPHATPDPKVAPPDVPARVAARWAGVSDMARAVLLVARDGEWHPVDEAVVVAGPLMRAEQAIRRGEKRRADSGPNNKTGRVHPIGADAEIFQGRRDMVLIKIKHLADKDRNPILELERVRAGRVRRYRYLPATDATGA